jgi:hypothetical protein
MMRLPVIIASIAAMERSRMDAASDLRRCTEVDTARWGFMTSGGGEGWG